MKRKGFTLIELLAVIVILAIIALIATPIVLNIISNSREQANHRSIELYVNAIQNAVGSYYLDNQTSITYGEFTNKDNKTLLSQKNEELTLEFDGTVECDSINIENNGKIKLTGCTVNGSSDRYSYNIYNDGKVTTDGATTRYTVTASSLSENIVFSGYSTVAESAEYTATIKAADGYKITELPTVEIIMGDADISSEEGVITVDSDSFEVTILIGEVTADVTITISATTEQDSTSICELVEDADGDGEISPGDEYLCAVEKGMNLENDEGYTFYVLSNDTSTGKITLIMNSNICEDGTVEETSGTCIVNWSSTETFEDGPDLAMNYLNTATSSWKTEINEIYDDEGGQYTEFKIDKTARLPYYNEISALQDETTKLYPNFLVSNLTTTWSGYWTFRAFYKTSDQTLNAYRIAWVKDNTTGIFSLSFGSSLLNINKLGVRPVISVSTSDLAATTE